MPRILGIQIQDEGGTKPANLGQEAKLQNASSSANQLQHQHKHQNQHLNLSSKSGPS
ncbi:GM21836 [Drosophila sechellia]|uniref:GM21836 n=1 Tax=Drosophila sechellia TaxID=7238 RepID=B4HNA1_DROSE|nr:GM21836 [Drosophila sechellia]